MQIVIPPAEVRSIREALGFTQAQLAKELLVAEHTVWRWESGMSACKGAAAAMLRRLGGEGAKPAEPTEAAATA